MSYASYPRKSATKDDELKELQRQVTLAHDYFDHNYKRFHYFRDFVFRTTIRAEEIQVLADVQKPQVEANVLEAYISRLLGEFSQIEPSIIIRAKDGAMITPQLLETMDVFGWHMRAILKPNTNDNMLYHIYRDLLSGGFSAAEIYVDYQSEMSMRKSIMLDRVKDPTLTYWDPMAQESHKGDGQYCGKLIPKSKSDMIAEYGEESVRDISFTRDLGGFSWSYRTQMEDILLVAEHWKKKYRNTRITELSNGMTIPMKDYEEFAQRWRDSDVPAAVPVPIGRMRTTRVPTICRYVFTESRILDYKETSFKYFPLIFIDGNSVMIRTDMGGTTTQLTKPYVMNCKDAQKVKNFALQSMANEAENLIQHKYIAAIESVPDDYLDAYRNPQRSTTLMYNAFQDDDPNRPLPPPQVINRPQIPQELGQMFQMMDGLIQMELGAYDSALGIQNNELSGVAIQNGAMQSNAASLPYNVGMMQGINRICTVMLDLIPRVYVTPRSIPVRLPSGKHDYVMINKPGSINTQFNPDDFNIDVEAGVNFDVQKQVSLNVLMNLVKAMPQSLFAQFMFQEGGEILLDNIDIRNIEGLKVKFAEFTKQQAEKMKNQPNPAEMQMQIQQATIKQRDDASKRDFISSLVKTAAETSVAKESNDIQYMNDVGKISQSAEEREIKQRQLDSEDARTAVDMAIGTSAHELEVAKHLADVNRKESD